MSIEETAFRFAASRRAGAVSARLLRPTEARWLLERVERQAA
ncbi:MAG: hypothetical protein R3244_01005 [Thermoanaerobaculia bacterium]|nr:hypothetical protein [Thermoanaerobaculia bacterium]